MFYPTEKLKSLWISRVIGLYRKNYLNYVYVVLFLGLSKMFVNWFQVAISTYLLNLIIALNKSDDTPGRTRALNVLFALLPRLSEPEAVFRALVGLGTLLAATPDPDDRNELIRAVRQSETALTLLRKTSENSVDVSAQSKLANCSKQIIDLII